MINAYYDFMYAIFSGSYETVATWNVKFCISTSTWEF